MRAGWELHDIGDLCDLATGGTPAKSNQEYFGGQIKWLVSGDIHRGEIYDCDGRITEVGMKNSNAKILPINSVIIALNGQGKTRGTVAILRTLACCNQSLVSIMPKDQSKLLPEFLFANLRGRYSELRKLTSDDDKDRRGLNMGIIRNIKIPVPPLAEQRRIVALLDDAFSGLETLRANAEKNAQNARELFDSYLNFVFSINSNDWHYKRLHEVAKDFGRGKSKHRPRNDPKLYGGSYPFVQTGDVRNSNHVIASYSQTYNDVGLSQSKLWPKGTLCITIAANIAETGVLDFDACFPDSVIGFVAKEGETNSKFVEYLLQSYKTQLQLEGKGSAQDNINLGTFEDKRFPFPKLATQIKIVRELDNLNADCDRLKVIFTQKLSLIDALKQSLLHRAFSGQLTASETAAA